MSNITDENYSSEVFEPIEETVPAPVETSKEEMPDEVKKFQSIADKRLAEAEKERTRAEQAEAKARQLEEELKGLKAPKVESEPEVFELPEGYDEFEAVSNPDSIHAINKRKAEKSLRDRIAYQEKILKQIQNESAQQKAQREKEAQDTLVRNKAIEELSKLTTKEEAEQIYSWAEQTTPNMENIFKLYKIEKGAPPSPKKSLEMPPGLGSVPGGGEKLKDVDDEFNESIKVHRKTYL